MPYNKSKGKKALNQVYTSVHQPESEHQWSVRQIEDTIPFQKSSLLGRK